MRRVWTSRGVLLPLLLALAASFVFLGRGGHIAEASPFVPTLTTSLSSGTAGAAADINQFANFDPAKGLLQLGKNTDRMWNADKNNFAPVLGMAYTPRFAESLFGHDDTVIRLGFRVGYDEIFNNIPANMGLNAPYTLTTMQTANVRIAVAA